MDCRGDYPIRLPPPSSGAGRIENSRCFETRCLLSWDVESTGCDLSGLESVCAKIDEKHLNDNDVLIQHSTESLGVEVLVSPTVSTLKQCVKNLLSTSTGHKHLIHVGYTFAGSGSWILQNGTFSFDDFLEIFQQADVQSQKRCNIHIHCAEVGCWNSASFAEDIFAKVANVAFNPPEKVNHVPGSEHLISCLEKVLSPQGLEEIMKASPLVGNIRFNRPTLYLFPAGQGDCALFGVNGFNMLIDGGFNRKPCSWEFIRHLDRLDAVLVTRLCENNVCGMSTLMKRKSLNNTYPQIGYVFCNIAENSVSAPKDEMKYKDELIISVVGEGHNFTHTLNELKLKPHQCWRDSSVEPFTLYHKVGHGTLEMHVLSPPKDSKEMKEFLVEWSSYKETFSRINSSLKTKHLENSIPLSHSTSICAILVWRPADPKDTITRILFPGSAPQSKIFESLEKLKTLDVLKQPVVTKASLSVVAVTKSVNKVEKSISKASIPNRKNTASPAPSVSSVASRNGDITGVKKEVKKIVKEVKKDNKDIKKEVVKKEIKKESVVKEVKKATTATTTSIPKKDAALKKDTPKEPKKENKDLKPLQKKENKDVKAVIDKRTEVKSAAKKVESTSAVNKTVSEVKKSTTTVRKSTTPVKKDASKTTVQKTSELRKSAPPKLSDAKSAKDVSNKKTAEAKAVPKTKPKSANSTPKTTPKTKPAEVPKTGSKMTKAVAASSVVASAVAVTVAALELNEKNEEIIEAEPEIVDELKDGEIVDKSQEVNVSPLPPEVVSPTPSESISLTPSDTLSSAPLETVSPTPPLTNEPMSIEEKEVNEIKEIEQDIMPYEAETTQEIIEKAEEQIEDLEDEPNELELTHAKLQENADAMSTSFIDTQDVSTPEIEEVIMKTEVTSEQYASSHFQSSNVEKNIEEIEANIEDGGKQLEVDDNIEKKETNLDDQLAHLSMEGSFCAGMLQQEKMDLPEDSNIKALENEQILNEYDIKDVESKNVDYHEKETIDSKEVTSHLGETEKETIDSNEGTMEEIQSGETEKETIDSNEGTMRESHLGETEKETIDSNEGTMRESRPGETEKETIDSNEGTMRETHSGEIQKETIDNNEGTMRENHSRGIGNEAIGGYELEYRGNIYGNEYQDLNERFETESIDSGVATMREGRTGRIETELIDNVMFELHESIGGEEEEEESDKRSVEDDLDSDLQEISTGETEREVIDSNKVEMRESPVGEIEKAHFPEGHENFMEENRKEYELEMQESFGGKSEKESEPEMNETLARETEKDRELEMHDNFEDIQKKHESVMHESYIAEDETFDCAQTSKTIEESHCETKEYVELKEKKDSDLCIASDIVDKSNLESECSTSDFDDKYVNEMQEKEIPEKYHEDDRISPAVDQLHHKDYHAEQEFGQQELHASPVSHRMADDYDIPQNIIDDAEMQESSVDEPEEIVRKESAVSITLNDNELGVKYDDDLRRKSCTESEDDVDIQNYMINDRKDSFDQDKLNVKRDSDSDNEDVVKSPTPHAVVDYEGHIEDTTQEFEASKEEKNISQENTAYSSEKQDFDEKDRDSAEDQEDDDGEMIRHPTPPEMKYSEDEMRDPIGQHYITAPGMKSQVPDIAEQPLYEESEDVGSERSVSPVVEQPVFGNVVQADYPELVTVSGGTTPSEPQSPKTGFDSKKIVSETAVMEALSEHDCSESSAHSPLIHDSANAFDLPVSEETFQKEESQGMTFTDLRTEEPMFVKDQALPSEHEPVLDHSAPIDDKLEKLQSADYDVPSDEESYSHDKSETKSEKSDGGDDEKSDFHRDDKSDNHHDGKSDIMDDDQAERKSDMHDDDRSDSHYDDFGGKETGSYEFHDETRSHATGDEQIEFDESHKYDAHFEKDGMQSNIAYNTYEAHGESGINYEVSYDNKIPVVQEKHDEAPRDFTPDMLDEKLDYKGNVIDSEVESHLQSTYYENAELENQENFNIPSDFRDEKSYYDNYETNMTSDDRPDSYSPNKTEPVANKVDMEQFEISGNIESVGDNQTEMHSNEIPNVKDIPEHTTNSQFEGHESEEIGITKHKEFQSTNESTFSGDVSQVESSYKESIYEAASSHLTDTYDDISPQHSENFSGLENKVLTEMTEAKQYETLSKFEENVRTSNATYSESSLVTNTVSDEKDSHVTVSEASDFDNSNYKYVTEETTHLTSDKDFEQATIYQQQHASYGETIETFSKEYSSSLHMATKDGIEDHFGHPTDFTFAESMHGFEESKFGNPNSGPVGILSHEESYATQTSTFENRTDNQETVSSSFSDSREKLEVASEEGSTLGLTNGKDQTSWSHSEYTSQFETSSSSVIETHTSYTTSSEQQETEYIINSRFHSDSPEDNVMRSDSSPDVPPYPVNSDGQLADLKNSVLGEYKDEYANINLSNVSGAPLSPNKVHNANRDNPYGESSEDEDSTSVPGTVSPYAYTNKAYAKEEEDVDGNHIYKESFSMEKTEILKEFDGNNPQSVTTHQMSYSQGYQETTGGETNYDFHLEEWGKPMGLPTPPDSSNKTAVKKADKSAKTKSAIDTNGKAYAPSVASKLSSPLKKPKPKTTKESSSDPVYVDLAYVPHHGDPQYCDVEFFKKIRARYYVFSGINPSKEVLNALLEAKKSWKEDLEVTIIPTYETDTLGYWMAQNQDDLATYSIEVAPSASRCTVNLQDHETSCAAYRLEF
ncbi:Microtubule-associated protein futsch like protein [Argiope bruennichi]|uniref:Microtubule-associated protein futsch like protein n=1 Tax=Argiope bruennichi TaxID=94029 RepID=A0A8T0ECD0_ARGBR|nr:Microtubule-associated protein futsch like protein [Argiope bruennichi]